MISMAEILSKPKPYDSLGQEEQDHLLDSIIFHMITVAIVSISLLMTQNVVKN